MSQLDLFATLEKIEKVQIVNSNRIDADDQFFCESQEKVYRDTVALFISITEQLKSAGSHFVQRYKDIGHFEDRLPEIKEEHVYGICRYFEKKYNVTLNKERIHSKYKKQDVTVDLVLDEIFVELGGYNFKEKADNEIKTEMRRIATIQNVFGGKVKSNRVTIEKTGAVSHCSIFHRFSLGDNSTAIFKALTHFECGRVEEHELFGTHYGRYQHDRSGDVIFEKLDLDLDKVQSIKFFKNKKVEIEFKSGAAALAFANDYCGYVETAKSRNRGTLNA
ncbi:hypothetical protein [Paenibacillus periandrae]|uniref:hypothetical protein n=1 Tax=Paenibacillus periandrae TaxID=1761741 RepID=UPI001F09F7A5|nr:hypothetical protein [Paenibacillus periandrae]